MANTWYVDLLNGNDSNNGSTFALRAKTLNHLSSIAAGDTVRIMQSGAVNDSGIRATWTNLSATVTLASALTTTLFSGGSSWTAKTNVICTSDTTTFKTGTSSAKIAIAAAFTTGEAAIKQQGQR